MASAADMLRLVCTRRKDASGLDLKKSGIYILPITSNRISRITDFGCRQSGALFGDFVTVSVLARTDSDLYPFDLNWLMYATGSNP